MCIRDSNQIEKKKSEQAALVYKEWLEEISQENPNNENLNNLLDKFLNDYKNTGYTQLALLSKANFDANSNNYMIRWTILKNSLK